MIKRNIKPRVNFFREKKHTKPGIVRKIWILQSIFSILFDNFKSKFISKLNFFLKFAQNWNVFWNSFKIWILFLNQFKEMKEKNIRNFIIFKIYQNRENHRNKRVHNTNKRTKRKETTVKITQEHTNWVENRGTYRWRTTGRSIDDNTNMNVRICLKSGNHF